MRAIVIVLTMFLTSCASTTVKGVSGPDGEPAYALECNSLEDCDEKAGEICATGYTIIDRASATIGVPANGGTIMAPRHSLIIECK